MREMNSYYSNLIEGHKTLPRDIQRALNNDYSETPEKRDNQKLSVAHIKVEEKMRQRLDAEKELSVHSSEFLQWLHHEFYLELPENLRQSKTKSGKVYPITPGEIRTHNVDVGYHTPPDFSVLDQFLSRFENFYSSDRILPTNQLVALAAAHHRLAWIHPFADGNGRVTRLYSHACLIRNQVDGSGLWTLSRGLARRRRDYYEFLQVADQRRLSDFDGRGNLSDQGLAKFCHFFLETLLDQIKFMTQVLDLKTLMLRVEFFISRDCLHITNHKEELVRLLKAAIIEGEIPRGRVPEIVGLKERTARDVIRLALEEELLFTPTPKGVLVINFPSKVLESYFPKLFLDLPAEQES